MTGPEADASSQRAEGRVGEVLREKWRLDRLIAVGGMGAVYEGTHRNGKKVAVKILHADLSSNEAIKARFLREGYVANRVRHRGVVRIDDDDVTEDGCAFLVMELIEGETLEARAARKGGRLPQDEVISAADQVLDALVVAHGAGVIHRDVKPENLLLTRRGVIKLLDFGIARIRELPSATTATKLGGMMGTPQYMPPEQARGEWDEIDARTDLWALGATMFTLLTGRPVHEGRTVNETFARAVTSPAAPVRSIAPDVHPAVAALVDRALAFDKAERWPDAATMQLELRSAYEVAFGGVDLPEHSLPRASEVARSSSVPDQDRPSIPVIIEPVAPASPTALVASTTLPEVIPDFRPARGRNRLLLGLGVVALGGAGYLLVSTLEDSDGDRARAAASAASASALGGATETEATTASAVPLDALPLQKRSGGYYRGPGSPAASAAPPASAEPAAAPAPAKGKTSPLRRSNPYGGAR